MTQGNSRAELRTKLFGEKRIKQTVTLDDGLVVEVRQATVGQMLDVVSVEDMKQRMAHLLIAACYVPGTNELLFEAGDFDSIMEMPSGGYYQRLIDAINKDALEKQMAAAKKTSAEEGSTISST